MKKRVVCLVLLLTGSASLAGLPAAAAIDARVRAAGLSSGSAEALAFRYVPARWASRVDPLVALRDE